MRLVVDASIAVKWAVEEHDSDLAAELLTSGHQLIAPQLILVEVGNVLSTLWRAGVVSDRHVDSAIADLGRVLSPIVADQDLVADALILARLTRHPLYDCVYLALAWQSGARVVTLDERFRKAVGAAGWDWLLIGLDEAIRPQEQTPS